MSLVEFTYDGWHREVEPHLYGVTTKRNQALRAYQTNPGGATPEPGWHLFRIDKIEHLAVTWGHFAESRPGYNPADRGMVGYFARIE